MTARRYIIQGRVQGVGYRYFAEGVAEEVGVAGWARNLDDGSVIVWAKGPVHALDRLEAALWEGSRLSRVDRVAVAEDPLPDELDSLADVTF